MSDSTYTYTAEAEYATVTTMRYVEVAEPVVRVTMSPRAARTLVTLLNNTRITDLDPQGDLGDLFTALYGQRIRPRYEAADGEMTDDDVQEAVSQ